MLSQDQFMAQLRQILPAIGWVLMLYGKTTPENWSAFTAIIVPAIGAGLVLASAGWALFANTRASIMKSVASMKETEVQSDGNGRAIIVVNDHDLSKAAKEAATPLTAGK